MPVACVNKPARSDQHWSREDLGYLADHYGLISNEMIARHLERTVSSIPLTARRKLHLKLTDNFYTAEELARTLGIREAVTIIRWMREGWLKGSSRPIGKRRFWCFVEEDIVEFLRQRPWLVCISGETLKHAHRWQIEQYEPFIARGECQCGAVRFFADVIDREILKQVNQLNNSTDLPPVPPNKLMGPHYFRSIIAEEWERDPWCTTTQAAPLLGTSISSVYRYILKRLLTADMQDADGKRSFIIRRSIIEAFLANDPRKRLRHDATSKASKRRLREEGRPTKIGILWSFVCSACGREVEILAPTTMVGPQVREKFISIYVNGSCFHSAKVKIELP